MIQYKPWIYKYIETFISPVDGDTEPFLGSQTSVNTDNKSWYKPSNKYILYKYGLYRKKHKQTGEKLMLYIGDNKWCTFNILHSVKNTKNPYGAGGASHKIINIIKDINLIEILKKSFYDLVSNGK